MAEPTLPQGYIPRSFLPDTTPEVDPISPVRTQGQANRRLPHGYIPRYNLPESSETPVTGRLRDLHTFNRDTNELELLDRANFYNQVRGWLGTTSDPRSFQLRFQGSLLLADIFDVPQNVAFDNYDILLKTITPVKQSDEGMWEIITSAWEAGQADHDRSAFGARMAMNFSSLEDLSPDEIAMMQRWASAQERATTNGTFGETVDRMWLQFTDGFLKFFGLKGLSFNDREKLNDYVRNRVTDNPLLQMVSGSARMTPYWLSIIKDSSTYGLTMGTASATYAGIASSGTVVGVPVAMASAFAGGYAIGTTVGSVKRSFELNTGSQYLDMLEMGIDKNIAMPASIVVGGLSAFLDSVLFSKLTQPMQQAMSNAIRKTMITGTSRGLFGGAVRYAKDVLEESGVEVLQSLVSFMGTAVGIELQNSLNNGDITQQDFGEFLTSGVWSEFVNSLGSMAIFSGASNLANVPMAKIYEGIADIARLQGVDVFDGANEATAVDRQRPRFGLTSDQVNKAKIMMDLSTRAVDTDTEFDPNTMERMFVPTQITQEDGIFGFPNVEDAKLYADTMGLSGGVTEVFVPKNSIVREAEVGPIDQVIRGELPEGKSVYMDESGLGVIMRPDNAIAIIERSQTLATDLKRYTKFAGFGDESIAEVYGNADGGPDFGPQADPGTVDDPGVQEDIQADTKNSGSFNVKPEDDIMGALVRGGKETEADIKAREIQEQIRSKHPDYGKLSNRKAYIQELMDQTEAEIDEKQDLVDKMLSGEEEADPGELKKLENEIHNMRVSIARSQMRIDSINKTLDTPVPDTRENVKQPSKAKKISEKNKGRFNEFRDVLKKNMRNLSDKDIDSATEIMKSRAKVMGMTPDEFIEFIFGEKDPLFREELKVEIDGVEKRALGGARMSEDAESLTDAPGTGELYLTYDADIITLVHEIGHLIRYTATESELKSMRDWLNKELNQKKEYTETWDRAEEEYFAETFVNYWGQKPGSEFVKNIPNAIKKIFDKIRMVITDYLKKIQAAGKSRRRAGLGSETDLAFTTVQELFQRKVKKDKAKKSKPEPTGKDIRMSDEERQDAIDRTQKQIEDVASLVDSLNRYVSSVDENNAPDNYYDVLYQIQEKTAEMQKAQKELDLLSQGYVMDNEGNWVPPEFQENYQAKEPDTGLQEIKEDAKTEDIDPEEQQRIEDRKVLIRASEISSSATEILDFLSGEKTFLGKSVPDESLADLKRVIERNKNAGSSPGSSQLSDMHSIMTDAIDIAEKHVSYFVGEGDLQQSLLDQVIDTKKKLNAVKKKFSAGDTARETAYKTLNEVEREIERIAEAMEKSTEDMSKGRFFIEEDVSNDLYIRFNSEEEARGYVADVAPDQDFFAYQDANMERIHKAGFNVNGVNHLWLERVENAGDIGREISKGIYMDPNYIGEKLRKLERQLGNMDEFYSRSGEGIAIENKIIKDYTDAFNNYPGRPARLLQLSKELSLAVLNRSFVIYKHLAEFIHEYNAVKSALGKAKEIPGILASPYMPKSALVQMHYNKMIQDDSMIEYADQQDDYKTMKEIEEEDVVREYKTKEERSDIDPDAEDVISMILAEEDLSEPDPYDPYINRELGRSFTITNKDHINRIKKSYKSGEFVPGSVMYAVSKTRKWALDAMDKITNIAQKFSGANTDSLEEFIISIKNIKGAVVKDGKVGDTGMSPEVLWKTLKFKKIEDVQAYYQNPDNVTPESIASLEGVGIPLTREMEAVIKLHKSGAEISQDLMDKVTDYLTDTSPEFYTHWMAKTSISPHFETEFNRYRSMRPDLYNPNIHGVDSQLKSIDKQLQATIRKADRAYASMFKQKETIKGKYKAYRDKTVERNAIRKAKTRLNAFMKKLKRNVPRLSKDRGLMFKAIYDIMFGAKKGYRPMSIAEAYTKSSFNSLQEFIASMKYSPTIDALIRMDGKTMTPEQMNTLVDWFRDFLKTGRVERRLIDEKIKAEVNGYVDEFIDARVGLDKFIYEKGYSDAHLRDSFAKQAIRKIGNDTMVPSRVLDRMENGTGTFSGPLTNYFHHIPKQLLTQELTRESEISDRVQKAMKDAGITSGQMFDKINIPRRVWMNLNPESAVDSTGIDKIDMDEEIPFQWQQIMVVMMSKNNENAEYRLTNGNRWLIDDILEFAKDKNPEMYDKVQKIGEMIMDEYDIIQPLVSEAYYQKTGKIMELVEGRYFPLRDGGMNPAIQKTSAQIEGQLATEYGAMGMTQMEDNFVKDRMPYVNKPINTNGFSIFMREIFAMNHYATFAGHTGKLGKFLASKRLRSAMNQTPNGVTDLGYLTSVLEELKNPLTYSKDKEWWDRGLRWVGKRASLSYLGLNLLTGFKQVPSMMAFATALKNPMSLMKALADLGPSGIFEYADSIPSIKNRKLDPGIEVIRESIKLGQNVSGVSVKLQEAMMKHISVFDKVVVAIGYKAVYNEQMAEHGNHDIAVQRAELALANTQVGGSMLDTPRITRAYGAGVKSMFMFTSQILKNKDILFYDIPQAIRRGDFAQASKMIFSMALGAGFMFILSGGLAQLMSDDEDEKEEGVKKAIFTALKNFDPLFTPIVESRVSGFRAEMFLPFAVGQDLVGAGKEIFDGDFNIKTFIKGLALTGVPTVTINRVIKAFENENWAELTGMPWFPGGNNE